MDMSQGLGISHVLDDIAQLFDYESGAAIYRVTQKKGHSWKLQLWL